MLSNRMRFLYFAVTILMIGGCHADRSPESHYKTEFLEEGLYLEIYEVFGSGAYGGDVYADYLTDSVSFRYFVGEYDNTQNNFFCTVIQDTIVIEHISGMRGKPTINKVEKFTKTAIRNHERSEKLDER